MKNLVFIALLSVALMHAQTANPAPASAPAAPVDTAAAKPEAAPTAAQRLMLMFSATDASGSPVANLSKGQLSINDNGQLTPVSELHAMPDLPIDMGIILLGRVDFNQQQNAAIELVKSLRPGKDRAFVMVAGGDRAVKGELPWLSDQTKLIAQIKSLDKHVGYPDPFEYKVNRSAAGLERNTTQEYSGDTTSFFDFAWQNFTASPRFARRILVVFRTPMGHAPGTSGRVVQYSDLRQMHVIQGSQFFRTPIFILGIEDLGMYLAGPKDIAGIHMSINSGSGDAAAMRGTDRAVQRITEQQYEAGRNSLNLIAAQSGGRIWFDPKKNYSDAISGIQAELAVPYVISFPASAPAEVHTIKLSAGSDVRVSVQQTIYQQLPKDAELPKEEQPKDATVSH